MQSERSERLGREVAPFESCIACLKGDCPTVLHLEGEPEFFAATIHTMSGVPLDQACETVNVALRQFFPGGWPKRMTIGFRVCRDCLDPRAHPGLVEGKLGPDAPVPTYSQPREWEAQ